MTLRVIIDVQLSDLTVCTVRFSQKFAYQNAILFNILCIEY